MENNNTDDVIVDLPHDGGEENLVDLNRQEEGEVEEQGGGVPQQHLEVFDETDMA